MRTTPLPSTRSRGRVNTTSTRMQHLLKKGQDVAALVDELADRLADAVARVGVDADDDRRITGLRGLQRRRT